MRRCTAGKRAPRSATSSDIALLVALALAGCKPRPEPAPRDHEGSATAGSDAAGPRRHDAISRADFNRFAVRQNVPIYWIADANQNKTIDPAEIASLMFYPEHGDWLAGGEFTPAFDAAYDRIVAAAKAPPPTDRRLALVGEDLDAGLPVLVRTDFTQLSSDDKAFVRHMVTVAGLIDDLYLTQNGAKGIAQPTDPASQSLFRRNQGPKCVGPKTEHDPECSALPANAPRKPYVSVYPHTANKIEQGDPGFCDAIDKQPNAANLTTPFTAVELQGDALVAVPYSDTYKAQSEAIAAELVAAADAMKDPTEAPLVAYLRAAAGGFRTNDWVPADEAWSKMTVDNSKWYVRAAPDEVYWEPCAHKAGYHLTIARINQGSKAWQQKLAPLQQEMEAQVAAHAGAPYAARKVTFHLPDFIDIVLNAGNDREAIGATVGESLPNWGPVVDQGRGRTVAMVNLFTDPDSVEVRRQQASSVLDAATMASYPTTADPGLVTTILHEATHNLGPSHDYKVNGKTDGAVFGGPIASMLEELKAQTGALYLLDLLRKKGIVDDALVAQAYTDMVVWALGHVSEGMYAGDKSRKAYGNLAAIQLGYLIEHGVLTWDANATAANGTDKGAFTLHRDKLVPAADALLKLVAGIKARGDKAAVDQLLAKYVDASTVVPHQMIAERFLRLPKGSLLYSITE